MWFFFILENYPGECKSYLCFKLPWEIYRFNVISVSLAIFPFWKNYQVSTYCFYNLYCCRSSISTVLFKCIVCVFGNFSNLEKLPGKCIMCFYNLFCTRSSISTVSWFKCIVWCVFGNFSNFEKLPGKCIMCLFILYCRSFISTVWFKMDLTYEGLSRKGWV